MKCILHEIFPFVSVKLFATKFSPNFLFFLSFVTSRNLLRSPEIFVYNPLWTADAASLVPALTTALRIHLKFELFRTLSQ